MFFPRVKEAIIKVFLSLAFPILHVCLAQGRYSIKLLNKEIQDYQESLLWNLSFLIFLYSYYLCVCMYVDTFTQKIGL